MYQKYLGLQFIVLMELMIDNLIALDFTVYTQLYLAMSPRLQHSKKYQQRLLC